MARGLGVGLGALAVLAACGGGGGSDEDSGSTTMMEMEPLEIIGEWDDDISGEHRIDEDKWIQSYDPNVYTYDIHYYDNDLEFLVARLLNDTMTYSKLEWAYVGEQLYYCHTVQGEASALGAESGGEADRSSPPTGGCVGMPWVPLTPQQ